MTAIIIAAIAAAPGTLGAWLSYLATRKNSIKQVEMHRENKDKLSEVAGLVEQGVATVETIEKNFQGGYWVFSSTAEKGAVLLITHGDGTIEVVNIPENCSISLQGQRGFGDPTVVNAKADLTTALDLARTQLGSDGAQ